MHTYRTRGTCSTNIRFDIENDIITHCEFVKGCSGNAQGLSKLVIGQSPRAVIGKLKGINCRNGTSCPDQLATALELWIQEKC